MHNVQLCMGDLVCEKCAASQVHVFPVPCTVVRRLFHGAFNSGSKAVKISNFPYVARVIDELRGQNVQGRRNKIKGVRLCRSRGLYM